MGICESTKNKNKKKDEKSNEKKINIPESEINENQKSGAVKLSSNFVEDDEINKNDYELLKQVAVNATDEEIKEASNNQVDNKHNNNNNNNNNNNSSRLRATKKVYYKQVKIEKRSDGTVIRTTIENGKKIIETFKPKNNNNNNNNSNRRIINNNNNNNNQNSNRNNNSARKNINNNNNNNTNHNVSVKGNDFQNDALRAHNELRRKHHSPNLILNNDLNRIAQNYAKLLAKIYSLQHSNNEYKGEPLGENIFMCQGMKPTGKYVTQNWYDEINKYNFNSKSFISGTGHFTQVVWKKTKEVGFGCAQADDGAYFCVANYFPCGNFLGEFQENVLRP